MSLNDFDGLFARRLARTLDEAIKGELEAYANGFVKTMEDLHKRTGRIAGLSDALKLMEQVEADLMGRPHKEN